MGFSGGGANILKPHTHNGLTTLDGGALNFNDITQSQSSAGMVFYSDGTHLQQLAYPGSPAGETLTASALSTAPSWVTAGAPSSPVTFLGSDRITTARNSMTVTISPAVSGSDIGKLTACWSYQAITSPATWRMTINGITSADWYKTQRLELDGGSSADFLSAAYIEGMPNGARQCYGMINLQCGTLQATDAGHDTNFNANGSWQSETPGFKGGYFTVVSDNPSSTFNEFTEIKLEISTGNMQTGGQLSVWSNDIS